MNILPFVSAFILLFSLTTIGAIHHLKGTLKGQTLVTASIEKERRAQNNYQSSLYKKIKGENLHPKKKTKKTGKREPYNSPRDRLDTRDERKFSLAFLFQETPSPLLEETTRTLLRDLYFCAPFYFPGLEEEILKTLKTLARSEDPPHALEEILPCLPESDRPLFYKLLAGTKDFTPSTSSGYPSLRDYFIWEEERKGAIHLRYASRPILTALFGNLIGNRICHEEERMWEAKGKHIPLSQKEWEKLLIKHNQNPSDYTAVLSFH